MPQRRIQPEEGEDIPIRSKIWSRRKTGFDVMPVEKKRSRIRTEKEKCPCGPQGERGRDMGCNGLRLMARATQTRKGHQKFGAGSTSGKDRKLDR